MPENGEVTTGVSAFDALKTIITVGELPADKDLCLAPLLESDGTFIQQEGNIWDFKREWPFSYSDEYFGSIARLICAFANTYGGLIVFGVHDQTRKGGHNKVVPNTDQLQQALKSLLSDQPQLTCRRYGSRDSAVDVLLVKPLSATMLPIRFTKAVGGYDAGVIWVRQGHEVVEAEPRHVAMLYCRSPGNIDVGEDEYLSGGLPPSPATIKRFVGRIRTIDQIFRWLKISDEPRTFLYGKGGSGKTTIAYEIARVLKYEGSRIRINGAETLDNVLFVTAKQQTLDVIALTANPFVGLDFSDERELYEAILTLGNWTSETLEDLTLEDLKSELKSFFDLTSNVVVIDDIDTLTTKALEAGFDFLYGTLWRSKRRSKLLYTTRNAPSQSLANSIEVPGLEGGDYQEFVTVCAEQFKVPPPDEKFSVTKIAIVSERRPLVIESIIALRRTAGNYDRAIQLFEESSGEDVRSYVFQREWNSLPADNRGRYVLAVLALHGEPLSFDDIVALTRYEQARVRDALAEVREMFLQINEVGQETTFQLGALTRAFVFEQSKKLDLYAALKERVEKYKRNFYPENPILSRLKDSVETLVHQADRFRDTEPLTRALEIVSRPDLSPKITEDPRFISLQAYVLISQVPPRTDDARRLFGHVFAMKFEPDVQHLRKWFMVERFSGHGMQQCLDIADFIFRAKTYDDEVKIEFLSRKATQLYNRGRNDVSFAPAQAIADITEALRLHLTCYVADFASGSTKLEKTEEYARNTAFYLFMFLISNLQYDSFFDVVLSLRTNERSKLDPIEEPLIKAAQMIEVIRAPKSTIHKISGRLDYLKREVSKADHWYDGGALRRVVKSLTRSVETLSRRTKEAK